MSSLRKSLLARGGKRFSSGVGNDCTPVKWSKYFQKTQQIFVNENTFQVYTIGETGPLLLMIHGGGYSALTWSLFAEEITNKIECQVLAIDLRGHGSTKTEADENLSINILAKDVIDVVDSLYVENIPPVVLIGHSLGGAVAVAVATLFPYVVGLCVIDVVEGTALESLSSMQSILRGRPSSFTSIEQAIQWSFRGGQTHNLEAARVSMPGQIKNLKTGELATNECGRQIVLEGSNSSGIKVLRNMRLIHQWSADVIEEENEDDIKHNELNKTDTDTLNGFSHHSSDDKGDSFLNNRNGKPPIQNISATLGSDFKIPSSSQNLYTWRIDLSKTEPFWNEWFKGLSQKFLDVQVPKVLLLANIHGLDTTLTVGQMQGKFQLQVLPRSGHAIHEDQPHHVADIIAGFLVKQKLAISKNGFTPTLPAC